MKSAYPKTFEIPVINIYDKNTGDIVDSEIILSKEKPYKWNFSKDFFIDKEKFDYKFEHLKLKQLFEQDFQILVFPKNESVCTETHDIQMDKKDFYLLYEVDNEKNEYDDCFDFTSEELKKANIIGIDFSKVNFDFEKYDYQLTTRGTPSAYRDINRFTEYNIIYKSVEETTNYIFLFMASIGFGFGIEKILNIHFSYVGEIISILFFGIVKWRKNYMKRHDIQNVFEKLPYYKNYNIVNGILLFMGVLGLFFYIYFNLSPFHGYTNIFIIFLILVKILVEKNYFDKYKY